LSQLRVIRLEETMTNLEMGELLCKL